MAQDTALTVISDAASELGLGAVSAAFSSTDANVAQLRGLLKRVGRTLSHERRWRCVVQEGTVAGDGTTADFDLPSGFLGVVPGTAWNRTQDREVRFLSASERAALKAVTVAATLTDYALVGATEFHFDSAPATGDAIHFDYYSSLWVRSADGTTRKDAPTADTDVLLLDSVLLVPALKVAFLEAKGFDSSSARNEYDRAFALVAGHDSGAAPTLPIGGTGDVRLLSSLNLPDSGYGG